MEPAILVRGVGRPFELHLQLGAVVEVGRGKVVDALEVGGVPLEIAAVDAPTLELAGVALAALALDLGVEFEGRLHAVFELALGVEGGELPEQLDLLVESAEHLLAEAVLGGLALVVLGLLAGLGLVAAATHFYNC